MNNVENKVQLDVFDVLYKIWSKKILLLISIILSIIIGVFFASSDNRVYRISLPISTLQSHEIISKYSFFNSFEIEIIEQIPLINKFTSGFLNRDNIKKTFEKNKIIDPNNYENIDDYDQVIEYEINNITIVPPILLRIDRFLYPDQPWSNDYNIVYITDKFINRSEAQKFFKELVNQGIFETRRNIQDSVERKIDIAYKSKKNALEVLEESLNVHNRTQAKLINKAIFMLNENLRIAKVLNIVEPLEIILGERDNTRKSTTDDFDSLPIYTDGTKAIKEHISNLEIRLSKINNKDLFLTDKSIDIDNEILALKTDEKISRFIDSYNELNKFEDLVPIVYEIKKLKFSLFNTPKTITSILLSTGLFILFIFVLAIRESVLQISINQKNKLSKS